MIVLPPGKSLFKFQEEGVHKMLAFLQSSVKGCYNASEMGCISGNAKLKVNMGGGCRTYTLETIFKRFNKWKLKKNTRSWKEGDTIGLNEIVDVISKGIKPLCRVETETKSLELTADHNVLTQRGWVECRGLCLNDYIATDACVATKSASKNLKIRDRTRTLPIWYPAGYTASIRGKKYKKREVHILIYEANLNGYLHLEEYLNAIRAGVIPQHYVDSSKFQIHHIDGNHYNHSLTNLQMLTVKEHRQLHTKVNIKNFNQGLKWEKLESWKSIGEGEAYDLVMKDPYRNFVANGIVVHNCGKTIMTIAAINTHFLNPPRVLIICPKTMRLVWEKEWHTWCAFAQGASVKVFVNSSSTNGDVTIASYNQLLNLESLKTLARVKWDIIVLDEAHYLKNKNAKRTRAVLADLWDKAEFHLALSGTPFTKNVIDGYTLFNKFAPENFANYYAFAHTYTEVKDTPWGKKFEGIKNAKYLRKIIYDKFFLRYKKKDVLEDLPDKIYQKITLGAEYKRQETQEEKDARKVYRGQLKQFYSGEGTMPKMPVPLMTMRREQGLLKVPALVEIAESYLEASIPIVVFFNHLECIERFKEALTQYNPVVITGDTNPVDRMHAVESFQNGLSNLFIGQIQAAGVGITLTRSSTVILAELDYSPSVIQQSCDRTHRVGQKNTVHVVYVVVEDSLEDDIAASVIRKVQEFNQVLT